jgi:hypothetical protein
VKTIEQILEEIDYLDKALEDRPRAYKLRAKRDALRWVLEPGCRIEEVEDCHECVFRSTNLCRLAGKELGHEGQPGWCPLLVSDILVRNEY